MEDRLLADAVRRLGEGASSSRRDGSPEFAEAIEAGRRHDGPPEAKVVAWAHRHPQAGAVRASERTIVAWSGWIIAILGLAGLIAGAGAARTVLSAGEVASTVGAGAASSVGESAESPALSVNIFWAIGTLLGLQSLVLFVWLLLMITRPRSGSVSVLGEAAKSLVGWCSARISHGAGTAVRRAAVESHMNLLWRGSPGRWTFSSISHGFWLAFNIGGLVVILVMLSTRSYRFHWETTILDEPTYAKVTETIGIVPEALGFTVPDAEVVAASRRIEEPVRSRAGVGSDEADASAALSAASAWSGLLVGSLASYGLLPRVLLMLLSVMMLRRRRKQLRLDLTQPAYKRLLDRLMPEAEAGPIVDGDDAQATDPSTAARAPAPPQRLSDASAATGPPAIIGLEIVPPKTGWPPIVHGVRWLDLGLVEDGPSRRAAVESLRAADQPPRIAIVVGDLTTTPDRGLLAFIKRIVEAAPGRMAVVLTGGERLRERGDLSGLEQRIEDWRAVTAQAGLAAEDVVELDLDHLTEQSGQRLRTLTAAPADEAESMTVATAERLEQAFGLIRETFVDREDPLKHQHLVNLQEKIGRIYEPARGVRLFELSANPLRSAREPAELQQWLVNNGRSLVDRLPARLRAHPRWAAAGAVAGVTGCVAAGLLATPVAFASLPWWGVIGGAMGQLVRMAGASGTDDGDGEDRRAVESALGELRTQLRASALHAMLLHVQGGAGESTITRILDEAIDERAAPKDESGGATESPEAFDAQAVADWLDDLRMRFVGALNRNAVDSPERGVEPAPNGREEADG